MPHFENLVRMAEQTEVHLRHIDQIDSIKRVCRRAVQSGESPSLHSVQFRSAVMSESTSPSTKAAKPSWGL
jgi:hypothetical protein